MIPTDVPDTLFVFRTKYDGFVLKRDVLTMMKSVVAAAEE